MRVRRGAWSPGTMEKTGYMFNRYSLQSFRYAYTEMTDSAYAYKWRLEMFREG